MRKGIITIYNRTFVKNIHFALFFTCIAGNTFTIQRDTKRILDVLYQRNDIKEMKK